jgi:hypothetical protein
MPVYPLIFLVYAQVFKPGVGKLVGIDIPPSKVKHLRHNLQVGCGVLFCVVMCCASNCCRI